MTAAGSRCKLTLTGRIKCASLSQVEQMVNAAWDEISAEPIACAFHKFCISNALNGRAVCCGKRTATKIAMSTKTTMSEH